MTVFLKKMKKNKKKCCNASKKYVKWNKGNFLREDSMHNFVKVLLLSTVLVSGVAMAVDVDYVYMGGKYYTVESRQNGFVRIQGDSGWYKVSRSDARNVPTTTTGNQTTVTIYKEPSNNIFVSSYKGALPITDLPSKITKSFSTVTISAAPDWHERNETRLNNNRFDSSSDLIDVARSKLTASAATATPAATAPAAASSGDESSVRSVAPAAASSGDESSVRSVTEIYGVYYDIQTGAKTTDPEVIKAIETGVSSGKIEKYQPADSDFSDTIATKKMEIISKDLTPGELAAKRDEVKTLEGLLDKAIKSKNPVYTEIQKNLPKKIVTDSKGKIVNLKAGEMKVDAAPKAGYTFKSLPDNNEDGLAAVREYNQFKEFQNTANGLKEQIKETYLTGDEGKRTALVNDYIQTVKPTLNGNAVTDEAGINQVQYQIAKDANTRKTAAIDSAKDVVSKINTAVNSGDEATIGKYSDFGIKVVDTGASTALAGKGNAATTVKNAKLFGLTKAGKDDEGAVTLVNSTTVATIDGVDYSTDAVSFKSDGSEMGNAAFKSVSAVQDYVRASNEYKAMGNQRTKYADTIAKANKDIADAQAVLNKKGGTAKEAWEAQEKLAAAEKEKAIATAKDEQLVEEMKKKADEGNMKFAAARKAAADLTSVAKENLTNWTAKSNASKGVMDNTNWGEVGGRMAGEVSLNDAAASLGMSKEDFVNYANGTTKRPADLSKEAKNILDAWKDSTDATPGEATKLIDQSDMEAVDKANAAGVEGALEAANKAEEAEADLSANGAVTLPQPADLTDALRTAMVVLTPLAEQDSLALSDDFLITNADIGEAVGAVDSSAQELDSGNDVTMGSTVAGGAAIVEALLKNAKVDLSLLEDKVSVPDAPSVTVSASSGTVNRGALGGLGEGGSVTAGGSSVTGSSDDDDDDNTSSPVMKYTEEQLDEIKSRRARLMKQYVNVGVQVSEGMNAVSNQFMNRVEQVTKFAPSAMDLASAWGVVQDSGRHVLFETLRGLSLSSAQMGVQATRLLYEQEPLNEVLSDTSGNN